MCSHWWALSVILAYPKAPADRVFFYAIFSDGHATHSKKQFSVSLGIHLLHLMFMMRNKLLCEVERVSSDQQGAYLIVKSRKNNILVPSCHLLIILNT